MSNDYKRVKVIGGYNITEEVGEGAKKKTSNIFQPKVEYVVEARHLAALFRREWELCGMPAVHIEDTNQAVTYFI